MLRGGWAISLVPLCCLACESSDASSTTDAAGGSPGAMSSGGAASSSGGTMGGSDGSLNGGTTGTGSGSGAGATGGTTSSDSGGMPDTGSGRRDAGSDAGSGDATANDGTANPASDASGDADSGETNGRGSIQYVFVIAMENHDGASIYGNTTSAPYINLTLLADYASATNFLDPLPLGVPSEPHYVWMEAGTNAFTDHTFTSDADPSATNSTASTDHLSTQIDAAGDLSWISYQEGIDANTGACPIHTAGFYAPKHDPFVFFQDVSGNPPSDTNAYCAAHHRPVSALEQDLTDHQVARYNFITPDQCNDMHGQFGCASLDLIKPGDDWLASHMPPLIDFCNASNGVIFVVWDEGESTYTLPFVAVGPGVKAGYAGGVEYTHSSLVKSVEEIFGLPILATVAGANDFADLFVPGAFP